MRNSYAIYRRAACTCTYPIRKDLTWRFSFAFYLRSFHNDEESWPIRQVAQGALGRKFRLSGIRDPKRRWSRLQRIMAELVFVFRYSTPKYMNLEAGNDWKERLWRSLGYARCVLIDVCHLTDFVKEEIELCYHCVGIERILFIGNTSRGEEEWEALIGKTFYRLMIDVKTSINIAIWDDTRKGRRTFRDTLRAFVKRLPSGNAGLRPETKHIAYSNSGLRYSDEPTYEGENWITVTRVLAIELGLGAISPICFLLGFYWLVVVFSIVFSVFSLVMWAWVCISFIGYLFDCGSLRVRILATVTFGSVLVMDVLYALTQV